MAVAGWVLDKSAAARGSDPRIGPQLDELGGTLHLCPMSELEQLYSARSAREYDDMKAGYHERWQIIEAPADILTRALRLQRDLAHHHGLWHRVAIGDLLIAETALHHGLGVVHVDGDYEKIAEVRPLIQRRLG